MVSLKNPNWVFENVETVLFDKDGTLIDLHYFWGKMTELRAKEVINRFNLPEEYFEKICLYLGFDINSGKMLSDGITALYSRVKIIAIFKENLKELGVNTTDLELAHIFDNVSEVFYQNMQEYTKPIDEALELVKSLRECGVKIGIVTSDSVESTRLTIKKFGWENLFDCAVGRECSTQTKESGALTLIALSQLDANSKTTVMIGDTPMDYWAAKNAGVERVILVASGQLTVSDLREFSSCVVENLGQVEVLCSNKNSR